jgi:hypothetical protein
MGVKWRKRVGIRIASARMSWVCPGIGMVIWGRSVQVG